MQGFTLVEWSLKNFQITFFFWTSTRPTSTIRRRPPMVGAERTRIRSSKACPFAGSISAILAIMSNGAWFSQLLSSSLDSQVFLDFLKKLVWWIENKGRFGWDRVIVVLDNWPSHTAGSVKDFFASTDYLVFYLPPYSPQLATVEKAFQTLKMRI